jgi:hypothetical protein
VDVQADSARFGQRFVSALDAREYTRAREIAVDAVEHFKLLLQDSAASDDSLNTAFYSAVLFRGLFDYATLAEDTASPTWQSDRGAIQKVWRVLCDCRDRISYVAHNASGKIFTHIFAALEKVEAWYVHQFGNGVYSSPEILVKSELCSICDKDLRCCDHIPGNVYRGRRCYGIPQDIELESFAMVQVPHDRRCRIWPWQVRDDVASDILLFTTFRIDDFLESEEWKPAE